MLWKVPLQIAKAFITLIYPPLCLHCNQELTQADHVLCHRCLALLEVIDPSQRCQFCFSEECNLEQRLCAACYASHSIFEGVGAVFDFAGPAAALVKKMKYSNMPYLSRGIAAYMTTQFCQLNWPMPDILVPVPISYPHKFQRGYNQSALLASDIAVLIDRPVEEILKRKCGDYSQAGLNREQRKALRGDSFLCKQGINIEDKVVLLIDDVMTTGSTLRRCGEALQAGFPKSIYALTFCRALR